MGNSQEETALHLLIIEGAIRQMGMYLVSVFVTHRLTVVICSPLSVCYMPLTIVNTLPTAAFIRRSGRRVLPSVRGGDGTVARRLLLHGLITLHTISLVCLSDLLLTTPSSVFLSPPPQQHLARCFLSLYRRRSIPASCLLW